MDGIDPQPIKAVFVDPSQRDRGKEPRDRISVSRVVKIGARAPGRLVSTRKVGVEFAQIIPLGAEVVQHDVQVNGHSRLMTTPDRPTKLFRPTDRVLRSKQLDTVVTPIPSTGGLGQRKEFDRGDPERSPMIDPGIQIGVGAARAQTPRVGFQQDGFPQITRVEVVNWGKTLTRVGSAEECSFRRFGQKSGCSDDLARTMNAVRLEPRHRVRPGRTVVDLDPIAITRDDAPGGSRVVAITDRIQRQSTVRRAFTRACIGRIDPNGDPLGRWGKHREVSLITTGEGPKFAMQSMG